MKASKKLGMGFATALMAGLMSGTASAERVTLTFQLDVQLRQTGSLFGDKVVDNSFVPFSSSATLSFDSTWQDGGAYSPTPAIHQIYTDFVGQNQFTSGLTALVPWGPPFSVPTYADLDRALYSYAAIDQPVGPPAEGNYLLWDKRDLYESSAAHLEYRHLFYLVPYQDTFYPIAPGFQNFRTDELMAYLSMLQAAQIPLGFEEYGSIYNYQTQQSIAYVDYQARAVITGISAPSLVPVPAAAWLLGSALGALGWMRRRVTNR